MKVTGCICCSLVLLASTRGNQGKQIVPGYSEGWKGVYMLFTTEKIDWISIVSKVFLFLRTKVCLLLEGWKIRRRARKGGEN